MNDTAPSLACSAFTILHAASRIGAQLEAALSETGLSMAKYGVLAVLCKTSEALPLSDLARRLSCVKSNVTQLVDRLESDGLVVRQDDPADRRSVRAAVTDAGRAAFEKGNGALAAVEAQLFQSFDPAELQQLAGFLSRFGGSCGGG